MRISYFVATSLDGYIAGPEGQIDWLFMDGDYGYAAFAASIDALVMGRATYDLTLTFSPDPAADGRAPAPAYVFTHRPPEGDTPGVTFVAGDVAPFVADLAARGVRHLWLLGGGGLASAFLAAGLVTDYVVSVHPVVLGAGLPLFGGGYAPAALRLTAHEVFPNGLVQLTYAAAPAA